MFGFLHFLRVGLFTMLMLLGVLFFAHSASAAVVTWDGGGGDNNWSTGANWSTGSSPEIGDIATFDATSTKNVTIDTAIDVSGIDINTGYSGTVTQDAAVTIGTGNMNLDSGAWTVGTSGDIAISGGIVITANHTFTHTSGTITITGVNKTFDVNSSQTISGLTVNLNTSATLTIASGDTIVATGTTTLTEGSINTGTLETQGPLTVNSTFNGGNGTVKVGGTASTVSTIAAGAGTANFTLSNANATVNTSGSGTIVMDLFTITAGTFNAGSVTFDVNAGFAQSGGTFQGNTSTIDFDGGTFVVSGGTFDADSASIDLNDALTISGGELNLDASTFTAGQAWTHTAGGTFTKGTSTVVFDGINKTIDINTGTTTGAGQFYNLTVNLNTSATLTIASGDTIVATGTTTLTEGSVNTGTLNLQGDVVVESTFNGGNSPYLFSGAAIQAFDLTGGEGILNTDITVNKSGGALNLDSALTLDATNQDLIIQEGTIDLSGFALTANGSSGTFIIEDGGVLQLQGDETITANSGYPQLNTGSTVTYDATSGTRNIKNYTYHHLTINGSGGTFTLGVGETLSGDLTVTAGTFDVSDQALSVNGNVTINGGNLATGTGVVTFGNASGDAVTISSGSLLIESDDTTSDIVKNASTWTNSGGTISYIADSVSTNVLSSLSPYNHLTIDGTGSTFTLDGAIDVNGALTITSGTLDTSSGNNYGITVGGNWSNSGTFTPRLGTVTFDDNGQTSTVANSTTFYDLTSTTAGKAITFTAGTTQTVTGTLTLTGADGNLIVLRSTVTDTAWNFNVSGSSSVDYVDVKDSDASFGNAITHAVNASRSVDSGGNTNWSFNAAPTVTSVTAVQNADGTVTITFEIDDSDDDDTLQALVQYDIGSGFTKATLSTADGDTTADFGDPKVNNAASYQVGTASGYILSSSGSNTVTTVWVAATDESGIDISTAQIRITPYDGTDEGSTSTSSNFALDLQAPTVSSMTYKDIDANGTVDRIDITFDETIGLDECEAGDYTIGGVDVGSLAVSSCATSGSDLRLSVSGGASMDTNLALTLAYTAANGTANSVNDAYSNAVSDVTATSVTDGAGPVIISTTPSSAQSGVGRTSDIVINFSEPIDTGSFSYSLSETPNGISTAWSDGDATFTLSHSAAFNAVSDITFEVTSAPDSSSNTLAGAVVGVANPFTFTTQPISTSTNQNSDSSTTSQEIYLVDISYHDVTRKAIVNWSSSSTVQLVNISYTIDGGSSFTLIEGPVYNAKTYTWIVPENVGGNIAVKIAATDFIEDVHELVSDVVAVTAVDESEDTSETDETADTSLTPAGSFAASPATGELEEVSEVLPGTYVRAKSYPTVYYVGEDRMRRPFLDQQTFFTWQDDFSMVQEVSDATLPFLQIGPPMLAQPGTVLVKIQSDVRVYALDAGTTLYDSVLRWVPTEELAGSLFGSEWSKYVVDVPPTLFPRFAMGEAVTELFEVDGSRLIKRESLQ